MVRFNWLFALLLAVTVCAGQEVRLPLPVAAQLATSAADERTVTQTEPFTLQDLRQIAFQNNPTLAAAVARTDAARGRQLQAGLYPNPVVGYHGTEIGNQGTPGQQGAYVNQRFITAGKLRLDQEAAGQDVSEAAFRFQAQEQRVLTDVQIRFFEALAAQRRLKVAMGLVRIGNDLVSATEKLLAGRLRTENDLLQAQIRADEAEILLENSQNELNEAWRRLTFVVGTPTLPYTPLSGQLEQETIKLDWENRHAMLLASHPELSAAQARAEKARILIVRANKEPIPNIELFVSARHSYPTDSDVANVQVGIPVPVFNRNQGNICAAESEWIAACKEIRRIELELQDRLAIATRRYENAAQQMDKYRERIVPRARRSLDLVTKAYKLGQVDYLTLLTAQKTYLEVNLGYINSLREYQTAAALIEGQLLDGSLLAR